MDDLFDSCKDADRLNRSTSQFEKILPYPDGGALEYLLPNTNKLSFQIGPWRGGLDIIASLLAGCNWASRSLYLPGISNNSFRTDNGGTPVLYLSYEPVSPDSRWDIKLEW